MMVNLFYARDGNEQCREVAIQLLGQISGAAADESFKLCRFMLHIRLDFVPRYSDVLRLLEQALPDRSRPCGAGSGSPLVAGP